MSAHLHHLPRLPAVFRPPSLRKKHAIESKPKRPPLGVDTSSEPRWLASAGHMIRSHHKAEADATLAPPCHWSNRKCAFVSFQSLDIDGTATLGAVALSGVWYYPGLGVVAESGGG